MHNWLRENPHIRSLRVAAPDLNAVARGKRMPLDGATKALGGGTRFPFSVLNLDLWGEDIENSPLVLESGDRDGVLRPTERGWVEMPWLETPAALLPVWMYHEDGRPFAGDPRHALNAVLERYRARRLTPVCAVELEFYLFDANTPTPRPPLSPTTRKRRDAADILSLDALDQFDSFFSDLYNACSTMGIPAETALSEGGAGQFEINLSHGNDALRAADDAWFFKLLVKGLARKHDMTASFMAKPYSEHAGSGMHMHFSALDADGINVFDNGGPEGTDLLRHAIAGCMAALPASTLVFAPHANSYARLVPGEHAPTAVCWGYENRTAALRVPSGSTKARRIEHRVAGGDVNPYLLLAAVLGAAITGIEDAALPPAPITGNAYAADLPHIPSDWNTAIDLFETNPAITRIFDRDLIRNLVMTKRQEQRRMASLNAQEQVEFTLDII
ncbi:MAG: glutamine synthetase family protein [Sulfitobacter sp.]